MVDTSLRLYLAYNQRRADGIIAEAVARIRRARRNDRPAMLHRYKQRLVDECVRTTTKDPGR